MSKPSPDGAEDIAIEAIDEWSRGAALYPETDSFPDGTGGEARRNIETIAKKSYELAAHEGRCTWAHVLDEEVAEALAETDPGRLRFELLQVAAVALHWVSNLDRRYMESYGLKPREDKP